MKVYDNGEYRDMTEEEIAEYKKIISKQIPKTKTKINKGEIFKIDGVEYIASTTIPAGDYIYIGTNCKIYK